MQYIIRYGLIVSFIFTILAIVAAIFYPINPLFPLALMVIMGLLDVFQIRSKLKDNMWTEEQLKKFEEIERRFKQLESSVEFSKLRR